MVTEVIPPHGLQAHIGEDLIEIYDQTGLRVTQFHLGQGKDQSLLLRLLAEVYARGHKSGVADGKKAVQRKLQQVIGLNPGGH